jgi:ATP-binding cassette subfamily B protein
VADQSKTPQTTRRSVRPLTRLVPYIKRYPRLVIGALTFLLIAAVTTLSLPTAVRG